MGKSGQSKGHSGKRSFPSDGEASGAASSQQSAKKLLSNNMFSVLTEEKIETKEKMPPFYVKGFPEGFQKDFNTLVSKGLKANIRLCSDGYKVIVPTSPNYKAVQEYLRLKKIEYFTHDIVANKPFKVVLRGLPDLDCSEIMDTLKELKLQPVDIFKIKRNSEKFKYRDQLYLVHFKRGTTTLQELSSVKAIYNIIIKWDKYKPVRRDVTQCSNCLNFGHGGKNCHIAARCSACGGNHNIDNCLTPEAKSPCVNCGEEHPSTSKACQKRAEFITFRQSVAARNRPKPKGKVGPSFDSNSFPELLSGQQRQIPTLAPLPLPHQISNSSVQPPGFRSYSQVTSQATTSELYSMEQLASLFMELDRRTKACKTKSEQVAVMMTLYYHHTNVLAEIS